MTDEPTPHAPGVPSLIGGDAPPPAIISYAQNAEDVRLWRVLSPVVDGFYVDIGAAHPTIGSVTQLFYERGWRGVNVEPSPVFAQLAHDRPLDTNLKALIGDVNGTGAIYLTYPDLGLSTTDLSAHAHVTSAYEHVERLELPQLRLDALLERHAGERVVHFLKVDVEGAELQVLASNDWQAYRPIVVVVEAVRSWDSSPTHEAWEPLLLEHDYRFAAFDGINRFYVAAEHEDLIPGLAYPMGPLDHYVTDELSRTQVAAATAAADVDRMRAEYERVGLSVALPQRLRDEVWRVRGEYERSLRNAVELQSQLADAERELAESAREVERLRGEVAHLHAANRAILTSRTWQTGRAVWHAAGPAVRLARRLASPDPPELAIEAEPADLPPIADGAVAKAYSAQVEVSGGVWSFASLPSERDEAADRLASLLTRPALDPDELAEAVAAVRGDVAERGTWTAARRAAAIEAEAAGMLLMPARDGGNPDDDAVGATPGPAIVVDVRALQHPQFVGRGVGKHAQHVLASLRTVTGPSRPLILLTDAGLPELPAGFLETGDRLVTSPHGVETAAVGLFVCLSAMTDSPAPTMPLLCSPTTTCVAVLFDFIPAELDDYYLRQADDRLAYAARLSTLAHYDRGVAISQATAEAAIDRLGWDPDRVSVSGVGDPLGPPGTSTASGAPFVLLPSGGDPRKNLLAALAAVADHMNRTGGRLGVVVVGHLDDLQRQGAGDFADAIGLSHGTVTFLTEVSGPDLDRLYRSAAAVIVPSFAEGFSIPVAEAARRGIPVVASDIPVHRELLGAGWWLAAPTAVGDLGQALTHALDAPAELSQLQRDAIGDLADPEAVAERLNAVFGPLVARLPELPADQPTSRTTHARSGRRPSIAVAGPLPPTPSGVADYTAFTLGHLSRLCDVTVCPLDLLGATVPPGAELRRLDASVYLDRSFDAVLSIVGNSLFHVPMLEYLADYGGACLSHDNRMIELYAAWLGDAATAELMSTEQRPVLPTELRDFVEDLNRLPNLGYGVIAHQADPLIVHAHDLAQRILAETGVAPAVVPFVPYNLPSIERIDRAVRSSAAVACDLDPGVLHLATFGMVDQRTKGANLVVEAHAWVRQWGIDCLLHFVGPVHPRERHELVLQATELGTADQLRFHGRVDHPTFERWLLAVDVAVQLRTSSVLSLSGAVADCVVHGTPTITNARIAEEMAAPSYVARVPDKVSPLLLAEAIAELGLAGVDADAVEAERRAYLQERTPQRYAAQLLAALGLEGVG